MKDWSILIASICVLLFIVGHQNVDAQEDLAQQAYAIFQQNCLNCHGQHGAFTEEIIIEYTALIENGTVIPGNPDGSEFYRRLIENTPEKPQMPWGQPPLTQEAIATIRQWIQAGATDWDAFPKPDSSFITPDEMLDTIDNHVQSLAPFDRAFSRYFTLTHLYNAGEGPEALHAYQRALSKLVNSLSWGREVINPQPIDREETIFYIDLRDYEWEIGINRWAQIEQEYPYNIEFESSTQTHLREKLANLRQEMNCEVPFVHVDWFLATASLPPLYHDILGLPETDRELEARLEVNVTENIRNAAGRRVWRAGFSDSGVSNNNRVVERHISRYGAYWKSYDFAGSVGTQNIFTHPLSFTHDGGEIVFNLPNGLQAYYLADARGNRLDAAPINIVSNPAASDPTVRNGLSCIGCHTEGMKTFEDQVRAVVEQNTNPPYDKVQALRLYAEKSVMDAFVDEDTQRYRRALEASGGVFGGIEPIQRFYEAFQGPVDARHAAAAVGLETEAFLQKIRGNASLQNLGLLVLENSTVKRDTWTSKFSEVVFALDFPAVSVTTPVVPQTERIFGSSVYIPDPNLRAAIVDALIKRGVRQAKSNQSSAAASAITTEEMVTLPGLVMTDKGIQDLTGIEFAVNLKGLEVEHNLISDLSPIAGLTRLNRIKIAHNLISDLSPIAGLINLTHLEIHENLISDLSSLASLVKLKSLDVTGNEITDLSPVAKLSDLRWFKSWGNPISDLSPMTELAELSYLNICGTKLSDVSPIKRLQGLSKLYLAYNWISDISPLAELTSLTGLNLTGNKVSDISPLAGLTGLTDLLLPQNTISDVSPLAGLINLEWLDLRGNSISDFSPLVGLVEKTIISRYNNPGTPRGGPKMEGPWLWVMVLGENLDGNTDLLAEASSGAVTERQIATNGATEGTAVGDSVWEWHKISPKGWNNINAILDSLEVGKDWDRTKHVVYGCVTLDSQQEQSTNMFVGSNDGVKVWLNGQLVHQRLVGRATNDYQEFFPLRLKQGTNVLLVVIDNIVPWSWSGFFGFEAGTEYTMLTPIVRFVSSETEIRVGDTFTMHLSAEDVTNLAGWQFDITFDSDILEAVEVSEGDFLKANGGTTFFQQGTIDNAAGKIAGLSAALISESGVTGAGILLSVTFSAKTGGDSQLALHKFQLGSSIGKVIEAEVPNLTITVEEQPTWDVNADGQISVLDLILVAQHLGSAAPANAKVDVNRDGVVSILDLILIAQHMGESTDSAAPLILAMNGIDGLDAAMIQAWIERAQVEDDGSVAFQQGIAYLQSLLALLIPEETALLPNYPNPFNPETWIPYQLSEPADVTLRIYAVSGSLVRTLALGQMPAGMYQTRTRAAYWDGKNGVGESVASGIYFYTLTAGEFTATRKMLIRK